MHLGDPPTLSETRQDRLPANLVGLPRGSPEENANNQEPMNTSSAQASPNIPLSVDGTRNAQNLAAQSLLQPLEGSALLMPQQDLFALPRQFQQGSSHTEINSPAPEDSPLQSVSEVAFALLEASAIRGCGAPSCSCTSTRTDRLGTVRVLRLSQSPKGFAAPLV